MIGMMWFDASKADLAEKINKALAYHKKKYGSIGEVCLVNIKDAQDVKLDDISKSCGILVKTGREVLVNNLWIGTEEGQVLK